MEFITTVTMSFATYLSFDYIKNKTVDIIRKVHTTIYDYYNMVNKHFKKNGFLNASFSNDKQTCILSFYINQKIHTICIPYNKVSYCDPKSKFNDFIIGTYTDKNIDITKEFIEFQGPNYDFFKHTGFIPTLSCIFNNQTLKNIKKIELVTKQLNSIIINDIYKNKNVNINELLENSVKEIEMIEK